jgi:c(7)-type cytochrome triheme protein
MRFVRFGGLTLVLGFVLATVALGPAAAQKVPADFTFEQGKGSPGPVTFSHEKHKEKFPKCTACHTKVFKMKKGQSGTLTMAAMEEGKFCGACHDGKEAFGVKDKAGCDKCHAKK